MRSELKEVSYEEFLSFLKGYSGELTGDVCGISEPPFVGYYDFGRGSGWDALVASYLRYDDFSERKYKILNE